MTRLNSMKKTTSDDMEKVYTEEYLKHIEALKENKKENTNTKIGVYSQYEQIMFNQNIL